MHVTKKQLTEIVRQEITNYLYEINAPGFSGKKFQQDQERKRKEREKKARAAADKRYGGFSSDAAGAHDKGDKFVDIPGLPKSKTADLDAYDDVESFGTINPKDQDTSAAEFDGDEKGKGLTDKELDNMQTAGEVAVFPAEFLKVGGKAVGSTVGGAALAAAEAGAAAADSPYVARPGRAEQYRGGHDRDVTVALRKNRLERKQNPRQVSRQDLIDDYETFIKPYIQKTPSGDVVIRGGGDKYGQAYDEAPLSDALAGEIKASLLDIKKRLSAMDRGKPQRRLSKDEKRKLQAQAKKLGMPYKQYVKGIKARLRKKRRLAKRGK